LAGKGRRRVFSRVVHLRMKPRTHEKLLEIANLREEDVTKVIRTAIQAAFKKFTRTGK